jgi:hypothetical protein
LKVAAVTPLLAPVVALAVVARPHAEAGRGPDRAP